MDQGLRQATRQRIDEVQDLAERLHANPHASNFERSSWLHGVEDRLQLLRNVLGVALGDGGQTVNDPDTGTGQQLKDYLADWDREDSVISAEKGISPLMIWAVKNALTDSGFQLKYPAPPETRDHFKVWHPGDPVP